MANKFINCTASGNARDGFNFGKNSNALLINCKANDNGRNGVSFDAKSNITFNNFDADNNALHGFCEFDAEFFRDIGLPEDTNKINFENLLKQIKGKPEIDQKRLIETSFLASAIAIAANSSTIISTIIELAQKVF